MAFACLHCGKTYGSSNAKTNHQRVCGLEKDLANERDKNATLREELKQLRQELARRSGRLAGGRSDHRRLGGQQQLIKAQSFL